MSTSPTNAREFVNEAPLGLLAEKGAKRSYKKGATLISEGEVGDEIFIIIRGQVRAFSADFKGKEITHGVYGVNEYVGEMSLDGGLRSANVVALKPTVCAIVTRETVRAFIQEHPDFAFELIRNLICRIRASTQSSTALALSTVYARLALFLQSRASKAAENFGAIDERLSHAQIAGHVGCSREMISLLMKDLESGGYLLIEAKQIRIIKVLPKNW